MLRLTSYDQAGRYLWYWPGVVRRLTGTQNWRQHCRTVPIDSTVGLVEIQLLVAAESGRLFVRELYADSVYEHRAFTALRYIAAVAWTGFAAWCVLLALRSWDRSFARLTTILFAACVVVAGLIPQPHLNNSLKSTWMAAQDLWFAVSEQIDTQVETPPTHTTTNTASGTGRIIPTSPSGSRADTAPVGENVTRAQDAGANAQALPASRNYWIPEIENLDKKEHFLAYAVLALLASLAYRSVPALFPYLGIVLLATSVQLIQSLTVTRDADITDLGFDFLGITLFSLLALPARRWLGRRARRVV